MRQAPDDSEHLRRRAAAGQSALAAPWQRHRAQLRRMARLRLDRRLQGRVYPADVLQEAFFDPAGRLADDARDRPTPTYLWLRLVAGQRSAQLHRRHGGAGREVPLDRGALPRAGSASPAARPLGRLTTASQAAVRAERQRPLQAVLNGKDPMDRESRALRHFEGLINGESAVVLSACQGGRQQSLCPCPRAAA